VALHLLKRSFTVEDYHRMAEAGILREGERVELIEGEPPVSTGWFDFFPRAFRDEPS
jgi:hypothetical protein